MILWEKPSVTVLSPSTAWEKPTPHMYLCISPHRDSTAPLQDRIVCATDHPRSSVSLGAVALSAQLCLEEASECLKEFFVRSMHEKKTPSQPRPPPCVLFFFCTWICHVSLPLVHRSLLTGLNNISTSADTSHIVDMCWCWNQSCEPPPFVSL